MQITMTQSANKPANKPTLGILLCGHSPETVASKHGQYDTLFVSLFGDELFNFRTYTVVDNDIPESIHDADGWIITGSKHGAYEDHAWIPPLEQFLRDAFNATKPIVGFCFGHQILAQALGGRVEKFSGGWVIGPVDYEFAENDAAISDIRLNAFHQDQVIELPPGGKRLASSANCVNAAIAYGDNAITLQPHPEFQPDYMGDLVAHRGPAILPMDKLEAIQNSLHEPVEGHKIADWLIEKILPKPHSVAK